MTKAEALKKIEENEKNNKELREFIEQADKPEDGDRYWYVNSYGMVDNNYWISKAPHHDIRFQLGNVFKTQEECRAWIDRQKAIVRVNDRIDELNDGWVADWSDPNQTKHAIYYDQRLEGFYSYGWTRYEFPTILKYIVDVNKANQLIEECEADLKLIWGIK